MREHITDGNAATVHAARAVTAGTSHAVLREKTTRAALYVATTHGRGSNNAYLYGREAEASEYSDTVPTGSTCCAQLSGKRSAPMRAHRPHTNSQPKPVENARQRVWLGCISTAAPTVCRRAERPTASAAQRSRAVGRSRTEGPRTPTLTA